MKGPCLAAWRQNQLASAWMKMSTYATMGDSTRPGRWGGCMGFAWLQAMNFCVGDGLLHCQVEEAACQAAQSKRSGKWTFSGTEMAAKRAYNGNSSPSTSPVCVY